MRYTINDYFDDEGDIRRHIKEFVIIKGDPPEDFPKFIGIGVIEMQLGPQVMPRQFSANLNADTMDEAFDNFDEIMSEAAKAAEQQFEHEMQQHRNMDASRIVIPGQS